MASAGPCGVAVPDLPPRFAHRACRPVALAALFLVLLALACESPVAPAACGSIPPVTINVGGTVMVAACFNDLNGDVLSYTAASSNPSVATASIAGTSITVRGVSPGNVTVTVTASDPEGLQGQQSFAVMVPNRPPRPRGTMPSVTVGVGRTATIDASQYFTEPDGEVLTYLATPSDAAVARVSTEGSMIRVAAQTKGSSSVTVTASDPGGLSATQSFRFTAPNRPPAPVGTIGARKIESGQSATLDVAASFSDPDDDPLTYTAVSSVPTVARTMVSGSTVTITAAGPGAATITITARDDEQAAATQQVSVTVVSPAPDLAFTDVSPASATLAPGDSVAFSSRVRNRGTVASGATTIRAMRSPNPIISARDTELRSWSFSSLAPSRERTFEITISADPKSAPGTIYIGMCVDPVADEFDARNNCSEGARLTIAGASGADESAHSGPGVQVRAVSPAPSSRPLRPQGNAS